jgi:hypothetical protein
MSTYRFRQRFLTHGFLAAIACAGAVAYGCSPDSGVLMGQPGGGASSNADGGAGTDPGTGAGGGGALTPAGLSTRRLRRLTRDEYGNTVKDLLGLSKDYGAAFSADAVVNGFDNNADALSVDQLFADTARMNAEDIAATVDVSRLLTCSASQGEACARAFIQTFGARALRRPVPDEEAQRYVALYTANAAAGFEVGVRAMIEAMLQSASFLYRTEIGVASGDGYTLTPYEIASELSYLFWKTMPDDTLLALAKSGDLAKPEIVAAQATRLFDSPKSRAMTTSFVEQWLEVNRISQAQKDAQTYPNFTDALRTDLEGETVTFFDALARDPQGSFATLLTADYSYLTPSLAQFYGVQLGQGAAVNGYVKTPIGAMRGGILTHGSILATEATPTAANPVRRGKLVRVRVLCQDVPPPPPGLAGKIPPLDPHAPTRQRFADHESNPSCAGCHRLLDPIGFGFEGFDGVGQLLGGNVDTTGEIVGYDGDGKFNGVKELETKLASSPAVQACFVRQWVRYGLGVSDTDSVNAEVTRLGAEFQKNGSALRPLVAAVTQAPYFFKRAAD